MNRFSARNTSTAVLRADQERVWAVLTDPVLLPKLTPYLKRIDVDGDRWTWQLARIPVLSATIEPTFTEVMTFDRPVRIDFTHDPERPNERTGVEGSYLLEARDGGTQVAIDLEIWCDLPLPAISRRAVETVMQGVVAVMGKRFGSNMIRTLGE